MNIKNALIKTTAITVCMGLSTFASAVPTKEKYEVLKQAEKYASVMACSTTFEKDFGSKITNINDVYLIDTEENYRDKEYGSGYLVKWGGDMGCAGGSGTSWDSLSYFTKSVYGRPFLLENADIIQDVNEDKFEINSRWLKSVKVVDGIVIIVAYAYAGDDPQVAPSERYRYTVAYHKGKWTLINKTYLGKNKF